MSARRRHLERRCARSTSSTTWTTTQLADGSRSRGRARREPGEILAEHGRAAPGLLLLLEGTLQTCSCTASTSSRSAASTPPTWLGAIGALTDGTLGVRMHRRDGLPLGVVEAADSGGSRSPTRRCTAA